MKRRPIKQFDLHRVIALLSLPIFVGLLMGCQSEVAPNHSESVASSMFEPHPLPPLEDQKEDNYISTNAREFIIEGEYTLALPDDFETWYEQRVTSYLRSKISSTHYQISAALRQHINAIVKNANIASDPSSDEPPSSEEGTYFIYFKRNAQTIDEWSLHDGAVSFPFRLEMVGSVRLMNLIAPESHRRFTFELSNGLNAESQSIEVRIQGSESRDAFPQYNELFDDGILDIRIHFGGDYNEERFDIETAKWTLDYLLEDGWTHPTVDRFDRLQIDSGPFSRVIEINGMPLDIRVSLFHADMVPADRELLLRESLEETLKEADIFVYSGHAGPGSGFVLDYEPRYEVRAREFSTLTYRDKYQIYVLDGCQTYRTYVDDLLKNRVNGLETLDVITAVNTTPFSVGYQLIHEILSWFTIRDQQNRHLPLSWTAILRGLNTERFRDVHYGVHGVDHDAQLNPYGGIETLCQSCQSDLDCGASGNLCLAFPSGARCGVACTTDQACGQGYRCARLLDEQKYFYLSKQCVPRDYQCSSVE